MKIFQNISIVLLIFLGAVACANGTKKNNSFQESVQTQKSDDDVSTAVNHTAFDKLLQANVSNKGSVDYKAFVKDKTALENYIVSLTKVDARKLSKNEAIAFWINAYNALTIDQIVRNYPVASITKIAGGKVWDQPLPFKFQGKTLTLNDIEKKILLSGDLFDGRIHFAVNCAALSCPTLSNKAFTGANVQEMLTKNTKATLANPDFNRITEKNASISKLFDWYKADFVKAEGSVVKFINRYSTTKISNQTKITYLDYNWSLNGK
ncbi:DUF547 domain-containing protein [Pedobacter arcticus]|uniref:DUF547 domain-containing protein n=1 Tax=Pedobacter arcticus TaxID=752140 RepID=UPI0002FF916C|nr:DUF547 domain-containing protein [Pedobacter arcticus]